MNNTNTNKAVIDITVRGAASADNLALTDLLHAFLVHHGAEVQRARVDTELPGVEELEPIQDIIARTQVRLACTTVAAPALV